MNSHIRVTTRDAFLADRAAGWNDLSSSVPSQIEVARGNTTLVIVDMQDEFLNTFNRPTAPLIEAVIRQIRQATKMGWAIVLIETRPWRLGETIAPIMDVLNNEGPAANGGKYARFARRSKQTPAGGKAVIEACYENNFGLELFRIAGIYLECCVLETVKELVECESESLVRFMEEACSTDGNLLEAWSEVHKQLDSNRRIVFSTAAVDA